MPAGPITHEGAQHTCPLEKPKVHVGGPIIGECAKNTVVGPEAKRVARVGDRADCEVTEHDTVRGGLITVWVEGQPAAREGDATDAGKVMTGLGTVQLGARDPKDPIPRWVADWLFEYLKELDDEIPYDFTNDGCYARADRMAQYIEAMDIPVEKLWMQAWGTGQLSVVPRAFRGAATTWGWHVAPMVRVQGVADPGYLVFDPTVGQGGPMEVGAWLSAVNSDKVVAFGDRTAATVYKHKLTAIKDQKPVWESTAARDPETTRKDLQRFRDQRSEARRAAREAMGKQVFHY